VRVILDTNVVMSGIFFGGAPRQILAAWRSGQLQIVYTDEIFQEYRRVGELLKERYPGVDPGPVLDLIHWHGEPVKPNVLEDTVTTDPDDEKFFAAALGGGVSTIVSGDKHVLAAAGWGGIAVLKPADFVRTAMKLE
jgi:putative PIN family toxin of toxin-antitoxin system